MTSLSSAQFISLVPRFLTASPDSSFSAKAIRSFSVNQRQCCHGLKTWATRHHFPRPVYQIGCLIPYPLGLRHQVQRSVHNLLSIQSATHDLLSLPLKSCGTVLLAERDTLPYIDPVALPPSKEETCPIDYPRLID